MTHKKKKYGALALMMLGVAVLAAACGKGSSTGSGSGSSASGTLTFNGLSGISSISGLSYSSTLSSSSVLAGNTTYTEDFAGAITSGGMPVAVMGYSVVSNVSGTYDALGFDATPNFAVASPSYYFAGPPTNLSASAPMCWVSGASAPILPTCSSWNITVSRSAGTINFSNTPVFASGTSATGTMSGSLSFTPF